MPTLTVNQCRFITVLCIALTDFLETADDRSMAKNVINVFTAFKLSLLYNGLRWKLGYCD